LLLWLGLLVLVLVLAGVGTRMYLDTQWFVGVHESNVALFRGIPTEVVGYDLFTLEEETDIPAGRAAQLQPYAELPDGIPAGSEEEARELIDQIEEDLRETGPSP
jgi:protein phosphatase